MELTITSPAVSAAVNQQELTNTIIANLNVPELSPLERYAIANMLTKAADAATKILSNDALKYALTKPTAEEPNECYALASMGKQFAHRGFVYGVTYKYDYNYAQPDEHGREWAQTVKEIAELAKQSSAKNDYKKGLQGLILLEHPKLEPLSPVPTVLSFHPKGFSKDGNETA